MGSTKGKSVQGAPQLIYIHTQMQIQHKYTEQQANKENTITNTLQVIPNYSKNQASTKIS